MDLLNLEYKNLSIILLKEEGKESGRMGQPQQSCPSRTGNKEILEHLLPRKESITDGGEKKRQLKKKKRLEGEVCLRRKAMSVCTREGRMESKKQDLSVDQRMQDH